jgi:hypothetical protein
MIKDARGTSQLLFICGVNNDFEITQLASLHSMSGSIVQCVVSGRCKS